MPDIDDDLIIRSVAALGEERDHHADRAADLEALAREMLATFTDHGICHRARVDPVQIAKWQKQLGDGDA